VALDLSAWENPTQIHHRRATASLKEVKQICSEAAAIVAPSEWIRRKFLEIFSVPMDKVVVAPPGIEETFGHPQECIVQKPFFIATATMHPSGNFSCLREAFVRLKRELPHILAVVGPADDAEPADWDPCMLRIERLPRSLLAGLYQHCDAYICPTLHEGSGMTMLEAMRAGARIISSRVGAIPEVAGDLPIYFNPESPASLVTAVHRALGEDPAERSKLLRSGKQVAAEYTWEKCACKTLLALRHACDPHE
jgi:glycosyltransferase involved in cell wall biosynthesis